MTQTFEHPRQSAHRSSLMAFVAAFAERRRACGYRPASMKASLGLVKDFAAWLDQRPADGPGICVDRVAEYLIERWTQRRRRRGDAHTLREFIGLIEGDAPTAHADAVMTAATPVELALQEFVRYLRDERGLAQASIRLYGEAVGRFLRHVFAAADVQLGALTPTDVVRFVQADAARLNHPKQAQAMTSALRSFLRYGRYRGLISADLHVSVPTVANWSRTGLPRTISGSQMQSLLAACDRRSRIGRRDYAVLMLLSRLGLRAGEVVALTLEDLDWEEGAIRVRGPALRCDPLPLPVDVGAALAEYLREGRPPCAARNVFICARAPHQPLRGPSAVSCIVCRALLRAGIDAPFYGAHLLRHSLATQMLGDGASLGEIGQILRHRNVQTTTIYAKVDLGALRGLVLPWPGSTS